MTGKYHEKNQNASQESDASDAFCLCGNSADVKMYCTLYPRYLCNKIPLYQVN